MKEQDKKQLPSYQAAFPVSPFHQQEHRKDLKMYATCGRKCAASLQKSSPVGCLAKMLLVSSIWASTKRFLTWKRQVTLFKHSYYRLVPSARGMNAQELLSSRMMFPTPLASDKGGNRQAAMQMNVYLSDNGIFRKKNPNGGNMEPAVIGSGVLSDAGCVGRDKGEVSSDGDDEKQGQGELGGSDSNAGAADEPRRGAQSGMGGMANGLPPEMDGFKLWVEEPADIPRVTENTNNRSMRLKALGNAVCPPQVFPILKTIADIETGVCRNNCVWGCSNG